MPIEIVTGAAAQANVASLPANIMMYGPPGTLKTTDAVRAFMRGDRCTAFVIPCEDGALKPIASRGWPIPDHPKNTVKSWGAMVESISWLAQNRQNYNALIIDGFSPFTSYIYKEAEDRNKGTKNKFQTPVDVRNCLFTLREWIRALGLHSVIIAHPLPPAVQDGVFYQGGFSMSPKSLVGDYFGQCDTVLRVDHVPQLGSPPIRVYFTGGTDWPAELSQQPPDWRFWRTKNREGCGAAVVPADLGAFLRSRVPPYPGL